MDAYNLRLEKSIAGFDQTHQVKLTYVYELPFGKGKRYLSSKGVASALLGGWRVAGIQQYVSGTPVIGGNDRELSHFQRRQPGHGADLRWLARAHQGRQFDPNVDSFLQPASFFGPQPTTAFGNETRYNPKLRYWPGFNENLSLARSINLHGEQKRLDFRWETFNLLNRTQFGPLSNATTTSKPQLRPVAHAGEYAAPHAGLAEALLVVLGCPWCRRLPGRFVPSCWRQRRGDRGARIS